MTRSRRRLQPDPDLFAVPDIAGPPEIPETGSPDTAPARSATRGRSRDGTVDAEVDEEGTLLSLRIPHRLLRGPHPGLVGDAVVEAIADARQQADQHAREQFQLRAGNDRRARLAR